MPRCSRDRRGQSAPFANTSARRKRPGERLRDVEESSRQLNSAIDRASRFLNLASLASVLLAAVAVVMGARRYASRHIDAVALMKCMGAAQGFVLAISLIELTLARAVRRGRRDATRLPRAVRTGMAAAEFHPQGTAACLVGAAADRARDGVGHAHRLRVAAPAAIEEHAAGASIAQDRERPAAALRRELLAGARGAVRYSLEHGARYRAGAERPRRRARRRAGADRSRLRAGASDRPTARRRRCGVALWTGQCLAPRHRQRGADRRLRLRIDGAVAAGGRAGRSAGGLAAQPAERCAE